MERDITQDHDARRILTAQKIMGVPAFEINGQFIVGLDKTAIEQALKYQVFPCPQCGKSLRTPTDKGRLKITCPHCGHLFVK